MTSGCLSAVIVMIFGVFYVGLGFSGLEDQFGMLWAAAALIILILFHSTLPISMGTYFYATNTLDWHWFEASLFTIVLITIVIPSVMKSANDIVNPIYSDK